MARLRRLRYTSTEPVHYLRLPRRPQPPATSPPSSMGADDDGRSTRRLSGRRTLQLTDGETTQRVPGSPQIVLFQYDCTACEPNINQGAVSPMPAPHRIASFRAKWHSATIGQSPDCQSPVVAAA